ncbi:permease prefix domain 1-containing protein [Enterococcus sp. AZ126]|uniref:permease prefix domain 1-containing protein n=1 Tax=Enterococcus sp. AZ126 TaxID=2774635 RepID=UPI003F274554
MKTIQEYIDSLFLGIAETSQTKQLKEDLLAGAEDRYEDLKKQGKSENEAIGGVISEFGSIDELVEEMNIKQEFIDEKGFEMDEITLADSIDFLAVRRKGATLIGFGVMTIMIGAATLFTSMGLASGNYGIGFGLLFLFVGTAIGVPLFIIAGISIVNSNKKLDDRFIPMQVKHEMKKRKENFQRSFVFCMVAGVVLSILSLIPVSLYALIDSSQENVMFGAGCMFLVASFGVFFFIFGGVIMGSFTKMLEQTYFISDEGELGPRAKAERDSQKPSWLQTLEKIYWPIVVAIFLGQGFLLGNWGSNWIIFPVAGIAFGVLENIFSKND